MSDSVHHLRSLRKACAILGCFRHANTQKNPYNRYEHEPQAEEGTRHLHLRRKVRRTVAGVTQEGKIDRRSGGGIHRHCGLNNLRMGKRPSTAASFGISKNFRSLQTQENWGLTPSRVKFYAKRIKHPLVVLFTLRKIYSVTSPYGIHHLLKDRLFVAHDVTSGRRKPVSFWSKTNDRNTERTAHPRTAHLPTAHPRTEIDVAILTKSITVLMDDYIIAKNGWHIGTTLNDHCVCEVDGPQGLHQRRLGQVRCRAAGTARQAVRVKIGQPAGPE